MNIIFVAVDSEGNNRFAFEEDKDALRKLSKSKELSCPNCRKKAYFHGGIKRIHHFNHEPHVECSFTGEPETQEHLSGKLLIYNWLKNQYPNAYIALEQRIMETNQIADVYADFGKGYKFAFEVQCSEITAEKWGQRRKLYRSAGIQDIWLFGANFYSEINSEEIEEDKQLLRLKSLQQVVNDKERNVYFIDVKSNKVKQTGTFFGLSYWTETRVLTSVQSISLEEMKIKRIVSPCRFVLGNEASIEKINQYISKRNKRASQIWDSRRKREEEKKERIVQTQQKQQRFTQYNNYLENFRIETTLQRMSIKEQVLFKRLVKEYGLTDNNFPGIFNIQMDGYKCIQTPYPLWQLLVFHKAIQHNFSKKQLVFPKYLYQDLKTEIRFAYTDRREVATLIHSYLVLLEKCGFLDKKTLYRKYIHPFTIENKVLQIVNDKELNMYVSLYYSEFNLNEIGWQESEHFTQFHNYISEELQQKLRIASRYYRGLVMNIQDVSFSRTIKEIQIEQFRAAVQNQNMELTVIEEDFLEDLSKKIQVGKEISQGTYDTFHSLIEGKLE